MTTDVDRANAAVHRAENFRHEGISDVRELRQIITKHAAQVEALRKAWIAWHRTPNMAVSDDVIEAVNELIKPFEFADG